jgi:hypothetical protein
MHPLTEHGINRAYVKGGYIYSFACRVPISEKPLIWSKETAFLLQAVPTDPKKSLFRLDLNPTALTIEGLRWVDEVMRVVFDLSWPTWRFANVTRIDFAVDLHGVSLNDFVWDIPARKKRSSHTNNGRFETLYLGSKSAGNLMAIYDKAVQQKLKPASNWTRVELRDRAKCKLFDLPAQKNPFTTLKVFNAVAAGHLFPDPIRKAIGPVGNALGTKAILDLFPASKESELKTNIEAATPIWWNPGVVWLQWPDVLDETLENLFGDSDGDGALIKAFKSLMDQKSMHQGGATHPGTPVEVQMED